MAQNRPKRILDPALGLGVFKYFIDKNIGSDFEFVGIDIDENILSFLPKADGRSKIFQMDYLSRLDRDKFDAIVCNPPYSRFQNFRNRHEVIPIVERILNKKLSGYINTASVFLLKSISELKRNGTMAYIMPYEFFNTGYGEDVKECLVRRGLLKQIIVFENEKEIFEDVTTTITVLLMKNNGLPEKVKITKITNAAQLAEVNSFEEKFDYQIPIAQLAPKQKWSPIINSLYNRFGIPSSFIPLVSLGKFSRGIATGANKFFSLNKEIIRSSGIPQENFSRCITRSPQINRFVLSHEYFNRLVDKNEAVFCLDVNNENDHHTKQYIQMGEKQGIHLRYLTKCRSPWYKIEKREKSSIFAGVFNRGRVKFIWNDTEAISFTCFHSFYPNSDGGRYLRQIYLYFISDLGQMVLKLNKRSYGKNLDKFEPNDLNNAMIPSLELLSQIDDRVSNNIIERLDYDQDALGEVNKIFANLGLTVDLCKIDSQGQG